MYDAVTKLFSGWKEATEVKISKPLSDKKIASAEDSGKSIVLSACSFPIWTYMYSIIRCYD